MLASVASINLYESSKMNPRFKHMEKKFEASFICTGVAAFCAARAMSNLLYMAQVVPEVGRAHLGAGALCAILLTMSSSLATALQVFSSHLSRSSANVMQVVEKEPAALKGYPTMADNIC